MWQWVVSEKGGLEGRCCQAKGMSLRCSLSLFLKVDPG